MLENISIGLQNRSGREMHECRTVRPPLRECLIFPLPLKNLVIRASSGQRKCFLLFMEHEWQNCLRSAFTNKSLRMEAFVCAAEHDDFCLGQPPKIIERSTGHRYKFYEMTSAVLTFNK